MRPTLRSWLWPRVESRPVLTVFLLALAVRAVVALVVTLATDGVLAPDEAIFREIASTVAAGGSLEGGPYGPTMQVTRFYIAVLAAAYSIFGPQLIVGRLLAALLGAATAAGTTALSRYVLPVRAAVVAGVIVSVLPSQVFFSAQTLKDAFVWSLVVTIAVAVAASAQRQRSLFLLGSALVVAMALGLLGMVRSQTTAVAAIALALAGWLQGRGWDRVRRGIAAVLIAVSVPAIVGLGPLAMGILQQADDTTTIRNRHAEAGDTGFVDPDAPAIEQALLGLQAYTIAPAPWQQTTKSWASLARLETLVWYPLLLLAAVGLWVARRHLVTLGFAVLYLAGTVAVYALASGDLMTAYRHRGEIVWPVAVLAALAMNWFRGAARAAERP